MTNFLTALFPLLLLSIQTQAYPESPYDFIPPLAVTTPVICRDFATISETSLPVCDFVMTDKLKTDVLALIITEQKNIESQLNVPLVPDNTSKRLLVLKSNLSFVEQFAIEKISDICSLKGIVIPAGTHLVSGCTYNQLNRIRSTIFNIKKYVDFLATEAQWPNLQEQEEFDVFINDILFDLAEKNKKNYPDNSEQKSLMLEVLKIYGSDGVSLYSAFGGICSLEAMGLAQNNKEIDGQFVMKCEEKFLNDLKQILFLAIR
jgi:hypothetical protein